jgi:nitrogen fixation/metabolism regulation signal transduction histidine kinase
VRIVANPVLLRALAVFICAGFAFLMGFLFIRSLRKSILEDQDLGTDAPPSLEQLPLHLYNTVIQQLKQQKHELVVQSQAEQQRARTSESFSHAVLANLSSGVLVFGSNGRVKSANPAAKAILGFASSTGMSAEDIFRGATVGVRGWSEDAGKPSGTASRVSDEIQAVLREGIKRRQFECEYEKPTGEKRAITMTVSEVQALDGSALGAACLINDVSELEGIRRQQELQGEMSAEMALQLRTSLATISGYAQQLAQNRDPGLAQQIAEDIAHEAAQLDRTIGGFLTRNRSAKAATSQSD